MSLASIAKKGDSVEIFGDHLPVTVLSDVLDTIPYEVLTGIGNRVKRVYFQDQGPPQPYDLPDPSKGGGA